MSAKLSLDDDGSKAKCYYQQFSITWAFTRPACISRYDLPAELYYIVSATGVDSLAYVGHSQGTTLLLAALAERPDLNDVITVR